MADTVYVVNTGLGLVTAALAASTSKYIGWGTGGNTAATVTDTGLNTPAAESRTSGTQSQQTTTTTDDTYQVVGTIQCTGSSKVIDEVGIFDASSSGNMLLHATFDDISVNVGDSIQFTIKAQFDQA